MLRLLLAVPLVAAQIVSLPFTPCPDPAAPAISVSAVYAQISPRFLNLTLLAASAVDIDYSSNTTHLLSTVFAPTSVLTFTLNPDSHSFCRDLRPPSPLPAPPNDTDSAFCPVPAGPIAFSVATPLNRAYELVTLATQIRVLDTSIPAQVLACLSVAATPLRPGAVGSVYGHAAMVFWASVAIAIAYWLVVGAGRLAAAWNRGRQRVHSNLWSHVQGLGFVLASAISGEHLSSSPALLRFGTPSMRDVLFHTQWCSLLGMITVQWPRFAYPFFAQTAWASLLYNVSLTQGSDAGSKHWNPLHTDPFDPPSDFADQIADPSSPLFLNSSIPNTLFTLPSGVSPTGIPALAATVGIRPRDAFDIAVSIFVLILAGTTVLSVLVFAFDWLVGSFVRASGRASGTKTPPWSSTSLKEVGDSPEPTSGDDDRASRFLHRPASRTLQTLPTPVGWLSYRLGQSSFHSSVLHGNLVRILVFFHLPITIFACYQFSEGTAQSSLAAVILAALAFVAFSLAIPAWLLFRLATIPTSKLYDETRTLLALGPLYNHYAPGSQNFVALFFASNVVYGVALGCGQRSGTAQAIIILVLEVAVALLTSVWLPWGRGAAMGGISFMLCIARIITAVLLVILSPVVSVGDAAGGWITYAILAIQGLVYLAFLFMLISKVVEGIVRLVWDVPFDRSKHTVDAGLLGALARTPCCGARTRTPKRQKRASHAASDSTAQKMLLAPASHSRTTVTGGGGGGAVGASPGAGSGASGPPSVLRPEHLNQPYKEESDDEGGYILGAWHYDDEQGLDLPLSVAVPATPPVATPASPPTSGFSRIAGGRANIASPFTMAAAAVGNNSNYADTTRRHFSGTSATGSGSGATVQLPPGARAPGAFARVQQNANSHAHAWRKSQSAIIEDARAGAHADTNRDAGVPDSTCGMTQGDPVHNAPASRTDAAGGFSSEIASEMVVRRAALPHRRRRWFGFGGLFSAGGGARGSGSVALSGDERDDEDDVDEEAACRGAATPMLPLDDVGTSSSASSSGGGSFVVIRDRRPARSPLSQAHTPEADERGEGTNATG